MHSLDLQNKRNTFYPNEAFYTLTVNKHTVVFTHFLEFLNLIILWCQSFILNLTLSLLVSSADNVCKQFGTRSGPTKCRGLIWVQTVSLSDCIPEIILKKNDFEKSADDKEACKNYPVGKELTLKAPRKKCILKMLSAANNCLTLLTN